MEKVQRRDPRVLKAQIVKYVMHWIEYNNEDLSRSYDGEMNPTK